MKKINIVIPMAGLGSRFSIAGYKNPKPFIDVNGKTMIERVIENLYCKNAEYILIARKEHLEIEKDLVKKISERGDVRFIAIDSLTEGTACTVLFSREYINNEEMLLIANSDQIVDMDIQDFINECNEKKYDGSILTFIDNERNPKWSFAKTNEQQLVTQVKEKEAISKNATVGIYLFMKGSDFVNGAIDMIIKNDRVNNEFYTCPVYNYLIEKKSKISIYNIDVEKMHGLGTPEDLEKFLKII